MKRPGSQVSATPNICDDQVQRRGKDSTATTRQHENKKCFDCSDNNHNANGRSRPDAKSKMNTKSPSASSSAPAPPKDAESQTVPHVVRVTFLGVAGILASPLSPTTQTRHPSLLFPAPEAMRVVATVSRTRTARGIPSGMSACLERASLDDAVSTSHPVSKEELAAAGGSEGVKGKPHHDANAIFTAANSPASNPTPPSRLMHARTNSHGVREGGANSGGKSEAATPTPTANITNTRGSSFSLKLDETQGSIEITASTDAIIDTNHNSEGIDRHETGESSENANLNETIDTAAATIALNEDPQSPQRYLAVWEQDAPRRKEATATTQSKTNTLAFEADLHPSSRNKTPTKGQRSRSSLGSFAPKTFCVTVGLVPDSITNGTDRHSTDANGKNTSSNDTNLPTFAIPIGFANLVINGDETLDGQSLQLDLPLTSLNHFIGNFGNDITAAGAAQFNDTKLSDFPFPLLELGNGGDIKESSQPAQDKQKVGDEEQDKPSENTTDAHKKSNTKTKTIKKSMVSRIFSRTKHGSNKATSVDAHVPQIIPPDSHKIYSGEPLSVFRLGRPPNANERAMFLERYNIDPSGDAVIRISLEVFQRGSELERVFRHRNRMRREQRRKEAAAAAAAGTDSIHVGIPLNSHTDVERTSSSGTGHSLVDDDDFLESDSDGEETQSC
ncbi:hypothetical protein ACHAW6_002555, partial [Cyclotella cf. meneghiniana]